MIQVNIQCPRCRAQQKQVLVRTTRDGMNLVVEYKANCECGQEFFGFVPP